MPKHLTVALVAALLAAGGACRDDGEPGRAAPAAGPAELAVAVCEHLVAFAREEVQLANAMAEAVTDTDDPDRRHTAMVDGWAPMVDAARRHRDRTATLLLPATPDAPELLAELQTGAKAALTVLSDATALIAALGPIGQEDERGAVGTAFNELEKALSVSEPAVYRYEDDALRAAFDAEPTCEHVVQPAG
ncbi:MAG: hypothetical protein ACSLFP_08810 [Acidimicrobiales bacterium]